MDNQLNQGGVNSQITAKAIKNATLNKCECGGIIFEQKFISKKISALFSPNGNEINVPIVILICTDCKKVPSFSDPENIIPKVLKAK